MFEEKREEFQEKTTNWSTISNILNEADAEICAKKTRTVVNP